MTEPNDPQETDNQAKKSIDSKNEDLAYQKSLESLKVLWKWMCDHPAICGSLIAIFGGLNLLMFLIPLGYLPEFDFKSILALLWIMALLGFIQIVLLGASLLTPSLLIGSVVDQGSNPEKNLSSSQVTWISILSTLAWLGMFLWNVFFNTAWVQYVFIATMLIALAVVGICVTWKKGHPGWIKACRGVSLVPIQGLSFFISTFLFLPGAIGGLAGEPIWYQYYIFSGWCVLVSVVNVAILKGRLPTIGGFLAVAVALVFFLVMLTGNSSYIYGLAIRKLRLGDISDVTVSVNESGAIAIQAACKVTDAPSSCSGEEVKHSKITGYVYSKVKILSRVGSQYYLQMCEFDEKGPCTTVEGLRVVIEKKDVIGWSQKGNTVKSKTPEKDENQSKSKS